MLHGTAMAASPAVRNRKPRNAPASAPTAKTSMRPVSTAAECFRGAVDVFSPEAFPTVAASTEVLIPVMKVV